MVNTIADQDSDSIFVTDQKDIAEYAKICYKKYLTIVNNIPKDKNKYGNTMSDFTRMDNNLAKAQLAIGESSNLAQIALTYSHNFDNQKYKDAICALSVLAQVAIDNAKRVFDIDIDSEIKRIKKDLDVQKNGYPKFWLLIHPEFNRENINYKLDCPMNYMSSLDLMRFRSEDSTLPMSHYFVKYPLDVNRRQCKKVEDFIEQYSIKFNTAITNCSFDWKESTDSLVLRDDFEDMIENIRAMYISKTYIGLYSWLLDRGFDITPSVASHSKDSKLNKNRSLLLKTLYDVNKDDLLNSFKKS